MVGPIALGICASPEQAEAIASSYDYVELSFSTVLNPLQDDAAFAERLTQLKDLPLPARACNNFVASQVKVVGPAVDQDQVRQYLDRGFARAQALGIERIVFGSGGARAVPEGYLREAAWDQLVAFCHLCADRAYPGLVIAIEPLNRGECNIITTFSEGVALARDVNRPNVRDSSGYLPHGSRVGARVGHCGRCRHPGARASRRLWAPLSRKRDLSARRPIRNSPHARLYRSGIRRVPLGRGFRGRSQTRCGVSPQPCLIRPYRGEAAFAASPLFYSFFQGSTGASGSTGSSKGLVALPDLELKRSFRKPSMLSPTA